MPLHIIQELRIWAIYIFNYIFNLLRNVRLLTNDRTQGGGSKSSRNTLHIEEEQRPIIRPSYQSRVNMTEIVLPNHADTRGYAYGGVILSWIDICAGISAKRHSGYACVTRTADAVHFLHPIKVGELVLVQASVNKAWRTSMEVGVRVETENPINGTRRYCCHAYFTFVALKNVKQTDPEEHQAIPVYVAQILPASDLEQQRYDAAEKRRQARLAQSEEDKRQGKREAMERLRDLMRKHSLAAIKSDISEARVSVEVLKLAENAEELNESVGDNDNATKPPRSPLLTNVEYPFSVGQGVPKERLMEESFAEMVEMVLPPHANSLGITFGGQIMRWMENCCYVSAVRHARSWLLTASIDSLQFIRPTYVGDVVIIRSMVSRSFKSSIEIYVTVEREELNTGKTQFTNDAFFTMVAVDQVNNLLEVPHIVASTPEELELYCGALARRQRRLEGRRDVSRRERLQCLKQERIRRISMSALEGQNSGMDDNGSEVRERKLSAASISEFLNGPRFRRPAQSEIPRATPAQIKADKFNTEESLRKQTEARSIE
ncbi:uncharacterized protein VTP21DRAFT_6288 [Calcarisporiella thermophila]|uniref:uncharacterized protein n=1 Tax=Calcarisporiella thermophila TaxID=911321 RepID=UPI0037421822